MVVAVDFWKCNLYFFAFLDCLFELYSDKGNSSTYFYLYSSHNGNHFLSIKQSIYYSLRVQYIRSNRAHRVVTSFYALKAREVSGLWCQAPISGIRFVHDQRCVNTWCIKFKFDAIRPLSPTFILLMWMPMSVSY